jgi:ABC-2 type transport system permease protein
LLLILSISFAGGIFAAEIEKGTIELLLAQPISRTKIFLSRYFAGFLSIAVFVVTTIILTILVAEIFSISIKTSHYFSLMFVGSLFGWSVFSIASCFSAYFSDKGKVYFATSSILVLMYVLNIVAGLKNSLVRLQDFSFFHYYNSTSVLLKNQIDSAGIWVFVSTILFFTILGLIIFNRRDIST